MASTTQKAAKDIVRGEWIQFGSLAFRAGDVTTEDGKTYIWLGYSVEEFPARKKLTVEA